jgi:hypothetical protein
MKTLVLGLLAAAGAAHAADPEPAGGRCLDPNKPLEWEALGPQSLVVSSLGRHFLIELEQPCDLLPHSRTIGFVGTGLSRICGRFGEAVRVEGAKCRIATLTSIDAARRDELLAARTAQGATEPDR